MRLIYENSRSIRPFYLLLALLSCTAGWSSDQIPAPPQTTPIVLTGGTIHTLNGPVIEHGNLLFREGKIIDIGTNIILPENTQTIDVSGKHVYPGLFAVNTRLGLIEIGQVDMTHDYNESGTIKPNVRAVVSINPDSETIPVARANGITFAHVSPAGGLISGQSCLLMLDGWTWEQMALVPYAALQLNWPNMTLNRERRNESKENRDQTLQILNEFLKQAKVYMEMNETSSSNKNLTFQSDIRLESMIPVLKKEVPIMIAASDIREIQAAISFSEKYDVRIIISGGNDAWRIADVLKERDIPVVINETHSLRMREWEPYDTPFTLPTKLHLAGVKFCIGIGGDYYSVRNLPYHAATAAAYGLPKDEALKAVTLYPAQIFGVDERIGTLETGKEATFIITNGDPLEISTHVERMFIQGRDIDLSSRHTQLRNKYMVKYHQ